jgi:Zn-dependent M28 family amino/carboxypeptidase
MSVRKAAVAVTLLTALATVASSAVGPLASASTDHLPAGPALARDLADQVSPYRMNDDLDALQYISNRNGGNREPGTTGYTQSEQYVTAQLQRAGFSVTKQSFQFNYFQRLAQTLTVNGASVPINIIDYSPSTPVGGITAALAVVPSTVSATPGCTIGDYANVGAAGKIVLVERGGCTFAVKEQIAAQAGAAGEIVYNNVPGALRAALSDPSQGYLPAGSVSQEDGQTLAAEAGTTVTLEVRAFQQVRTSSNLIAQTRTGNQHNVVLVNGNLDSIDGAGENDNGTGTAAMLQIAQHLGARPRITNAVRFVFTSAQEYSFAGAAAYLASLSTTQQQDIALDLNAEMLGSPNIGYFVIDGLPGTGSAAIAQEFYAYYKATGVPTEAAPLSGRWDYNAFVGDNIPTGGLFSGADATKTQAEATMWGGTVGEAFDPCYQIACDTLSNVNRTALLRNARALAFVVGAYATSTKGVNAK